MMSHPNRDRNRSSRQPSKTPTVQWEEFLQDLSQRAARTPGFYSLIKDTRLKRLENQSITLLFSDRDRATQAQAQIDRVLSSIRKDPAFPFQRIEQISCEFDDPTEMRVENPLQALNFEPFGIETKNGETRELEKPVLSKAAEADTTCQPLYTLLRQKTEALADVLLPVPFPWRVRVGGMRGFRDLLLPALHTVYGVPYIPSSSLKGLIRAWATKPESRVSQETMRDLLGWLDGNRASIGKVQILDAFPTQPCLSVDISNPQWHWNQSRVQYKPEPHLLLSMEKPNLLIGLARTSRGSISDVNLVKDWLEHALAELGLGSRISAGYGRTQNPDNLPCSSQWGFQLWTQGMYGFNPPSKENKYQGTPEFRPAAIKGMLRYWFRAIALSLYSPELCKTLEGDLFGTIEPSAKEGSIKLSVNVESQSKQPQEFPYSYEGSILLQAKTLAHLTLVEKILQLSFHCSGVGRGTRRPLHWNNNRLRGCHWQPSDRRQILDRTQWTPMLQDLKQAFLEIHAATTPADGDPGEPGQRHQDVLNHSTKLYLMPCSKLHHPQQVSNWKQIGATSAARGEALDLLYSSDRYKGETRDNQNRITGGNSAVGGTLGTPSYVVIKSNFPANEQPYQVVIIFGADHHADRQALAADLEQDGAVPISLDVFS